MKLLVMLAVLSLPHELKLVALTETGRALYSPGAVGGRVPLLVARGGLGAPGRQQLRLRRLTRATRYVQACSSFFLCGNVY